MSTNLLIILIFVFLIAIEFVMLSIFVAVIERYIKQLVEDNNRRQIIFERRKYNIEHIDEFR